MSLRNEPRDPKTSGSVQSSYNWQGWYGFVRRGVDAIHTANPALLVFLSGLSYDTYMTPVVQGTALTPGTGKFSRSDFAGTAGQDKLVVELHNYENGASSCSSLQSNLVRNGFSALSASGAAAFPVVMTEFGFAMDDKAWRGTYATCLASFLPQQKAGWMIWVIAGSYYVRSGRQDFDEAWGMVTRDWSEWRSPGYINSQAIPMIKATLG